jgi:acetylornithine/N-succinyldiaminopimelate aminotransferase
LITFTSAFHGRTLATISASNQDKMHKGFMPLLAGFKYAEFDDLESAKAQMGPNTAGFLVEPIQGEGGIRPASEAFMQGLRKLADDNDLMLALDEVQCGVARTGTLYAYEQYGIEPDILATAKGIGGGFPLGACLATEKAARGMTFGTHGSTYGGNPLAMAAGMAVLDAVANDEFLARVRDKGERIRARLEQFIGNYPELFDCVRGRGLMLGIRMKVESRPFFQHLRDKHQLLTVAAGDNTLRVLPPLVVGDAEIDEFFDKLSAGAADYEVAKAA